VAVPLGVRPRCLVIPAVRYRETRETRDEFNVILSRIDNNNKKNNPEVRCFATGTFQGILLVSSSVVLDPNPPPSLPGVQRKKR
jgi:hypothetical protein